MAEADSSASAPPPAKEPTPSPTSESKPSSEPGVSTTSTLAEPISPLRPQKPSPRPSPRVPTGGKTLGGLPSSASAAVKPPSYRAVAASSGVGAGRDRDRRDDRLDKRGGGYGAGRDRDRDRDDRYRDRSSRSFGGAGGREYGRGREERTERAENKGSDSRSSSPDGGRAQLHPLESDWTIWFDSNKRPAKGGGLKSWESKLREVGHFNNVEYFWRYYNHLEKPSNLEMSSNYHFFRTGIKPMWEDEANKGGGKWTVRMQPKDKQHLDTFWLNLVLAMIGEVLDQTEDICGAVFSRRKGGDRISVWTADRTDEEGIIKLGRQLKEVLCDGISPTPQLTLQYSYHEDSIKLGSGYATLPAQFTL